MKREYSIVTAKNALEMLFGEADTVTPEQAFQNANRSGKDSQTNYNWLYNKLAAIRHFGLAEVHKQAVEGKAKIIDATLTPAGRELLKGTPQAYTRSKQPSPTIAPPTRRQLTLQSITDDIDEFARQNPSWKLELLVKRVDKDQQPAQA